MQKKVVSVLAGIMAALIIFGIIAMAVPYIVG